VDNVFTSGINQYVTGAKRFKRQAVDDHAKSANHKQAIANNRVTQLVKVLDENHHLTFY
jgi:hypothetical protein